MPKRALATGARSVNPATGELLREIPYLSDREAAARVRSASRAQPEWSAVGFEERGRALCRAAELLREREDSLAELMALEMGKPIAEGVGEVRKCADHFEYSAEVAKTLLAPEPVAGMPGASVVFRPVGVVLAIMPWNYPLWQVFRQAATAMSAGNTIALKHAPNVFGCAEAIQAIFDDAGFVKDAFVHLPIRAEQVGPLIHHDAIAMVSLTGSCTAGRAVGAEAGRALKKAVLELGGSDPYVVLADADVFAAARLCAQARLLNGGQSCIGAKRFIVVREVLDEFTKHFVDAMAAVQPADPLLPTTSLGPLCHVQARDALHEQVRRSVEAGATLLLGGEVPDGPGAYYPPTVLTGVTKSCPAYHEELFGPVATIIAAESEAEAIAIANDSPFGLGAGVFTKDLERGQRIAEDELIAGMAFVNDFCKSNSRYPFGGEKASGIGRECGLYGLREFCNIKTVVTKR